MPLSPALGNCVVSFESATGTPAAGPYRAPRAQVLDQGVDRMITDEQYEAARRRA